MTFDLMEAPQPGCQETTQRGSILIIDDDESMAEVLAERLKRQHFRVIAATSGAAGLAAARSERPNLILLDLGLPDCDGLDVCQKMADSIETGHIPVIVLSGREGADLVRRCRAAGSCYFLRKPYDPNALLLLIRDALVDGWDEG